MIKAKKITIERAEGPCELCTAQTFTGRDIWWQAECWLRGMGDTYPKTGGYDKHDLRVEFEDGEVFEGRLDCKHPECDDNDLNPAEHVRRFWRFYAGEYRPDHLTPEEYAKHIKPFRESAMQALTKYIVGDPSSEPIRKPTSDEHDDYTNGHL
jgi:hypothetical protein